MIRKDETEVLFPCPLCDRLFTDIVWHCIGCAHHWPLEVKSCKNCYTPMNARNSPEHKRKAIVAFLQNAVLRKLSDKTIADVIGTTAPTVARVRKTNKNWQVPMVMNKRGVWRKRTINRTK